MKAKSSAFSTSDVNGMGHVVIVIFAIFFCVFLLWAARQVDDASTSKDMLARDVLTGRSRGVTEKDACHCWMTP